MFGRTTPLHQAHRRRPRTRCSHSVQLSSQFVVVAAESAIRQLQMENQLVRFEPVVSEVVRQLVVVHSLEVPELALRAGAVRLLEAQALELLSVHSLEVQLQAAPKQVDGAAKLRWTAVDDVVAPRCLAQPMPVYDEAELLRRLVGDGAVALRLLADSRRLPVSLAAFAGVLQEMHHLQRSFLRVEQSCSRADEH